VVGFVHLGGSLLWNYKYVCAYNNLSQQNLLTQMGFEPAVLLC